MSSSGIDSASFSMLDSFEESGFVVILFYSVYRDLDSVKSDLLEYGYHMIVDEIGVGDQFLILDLFFGFRFEPFVNCFDFCRHQQRFSAIPCQRHSLDLFLVVDVIDYFVDCLFCDRPWIFLWLETVGTLEVASGCRCDDQRHVFGAVCIRQKSCQ